MDTFGKRGMRWNMALITKAKAWYAVTYARAFRSSSEFRSFPWIVWDILLILKRQIVSVYIISTNFNEYERMVLFPKK